MSVVVRTLDRLGLRRHLGTAESLRGRYTRSAFWSMAGSGFSQSLGLVASIVVARLLGPECYGDMGIIRSTTATFGIFAGFGLGITATRYLAELRSSDPQRAGRVWGLIDSTAIGTSVLAVLLVLALAPVIADRMLHAPHLTGLLRLSALVLIFNALMQIQNAALAGLEAFPQIAKVELVRGLINLPVMIVATYVWGLPGAIFGLGLAAAGGFLVGRMALYSAGKRRGVSLQRRGASGELAVLWKSSLPALSSSLMLIIGEWLCAAVLFRQMGGRVQVGWYNAANQWLGPIEFVPMILAGPSLSLLSNTYGTGDLRQFRRLTLASVGLVFAFTALTGGTVAVLAPWILRAYGERYAAATAVLQIACAMVVLRATARATSQVIMATGRLWAEFTCSLLRMTLQFSLLYVAFLHWGAFGLGVSMSIAFALQLALQAAFVFLIVGRAPIKLPVKS